MKSKGFDPTSIVLDLRVMDSSDIISNYLNLKRWEKVVKLHRLSKYARNPQSFKPGDEWHPFEASTGGTWRSGANSDMVNSLIHAIPQDSTWQGIGVGPLSFQVAMACAIHGGHIGVGLEDSIYSDVLTKTKARGNGDLVDRAVQIVRLAGCEVATPVEARTLLSLPRKERE